MKDDELPPCIGEKLRRAFDDIFAPDARSDQKEEDENASNSKTREARSR